MQEPRLAGFLPEGRPTQPEFRRKRPRHEVRAGAVYVRISCHTQKPPGLTDGSPLRLRGGFLRRAVLERSPCLPSHGKHGLNEVSGALPVCRGNGPR